MESNCLPVEAYLHILLNKFSEIFGEVLIRKDTNAILRLHEMSPTFTTQLKGLCIANITLLTVARGRQLTA
jgi:hypothetical protein